jgi:hypothetical protein
VKYLFFVVFLSSCTISVILNHSEGTTSDLVDENQTASPTVSPTLNVPAIP